MKCIPSTQSLRYLRHVLRTQCSPNVVYAAHHPFLRATPLCRKFHATPALDRIETHILSDIGEGVKEVQVIQWFVEEGAQIEEWAPLCEVQSDKASVEITSKYSGVIKKIHFPRDAIVQVGDGMLDIEVEGEEESEPGEEQDAEGEEEVEQSEGRDAEGEEAVKEAEQAGESTPTKSAEKDDGPPAKAVKEQPAKKPVERETSKEQASDTAGSLATPAVRALLKEHNISIEEVKGTGKDGRVLKEDVYQYLEGGSKPSDQPTPSVSKPQIDSKQTETAQKLSAIQSAMFKTMTASLSIPHFLYSDSVNTASLAAMRSRINATRNPETTPKISYMPFIIKAVSMAMNKYPVLNARLDATTDANRPQLLLRSNHNIGVAMDTPSGLMVPVIKSVNARSITSIAQELQRLSQLGKSGKLSNADLSGGTITVSNIGSIGGEVVAPVIVEGQLAIMGVGKIKSVPVFGKDGQVERAEMMNVSWSADHRVIDGATMARMAQVVQGYLEEPGSMVIDLS